MLNLTIGNILNIIKNDFGVDLPSTGFLTGQGFATLILRENGFNKYKKEPILVINDIDVFDINFYKDAPQKNNVSSVIPRNNNTYINDYGTLIKYRSSNYFFVSSTKLGLLNTTHYSSRLSSSFDYIKREKEDFIAKNGEVAFIKKYQLEFIENILSSFDFNCVQVAYDLENDVLLYTSAFEKFFLSGELELVDFHSPEVSLLRALKKSNEQGYYFNKDKFILKCYFISRTSAKFTFISDLAISKYQDEIDSLDSIFSLEKINPVEFIASFNLHPCSYRHRNDNVLYSKFKIKDLSILDEAFYLYNNIMFFYIDNKAASDFFDLFISNKKVLYNHLKYLKNNQISGVSNYLHYNMDSSIMGYKKALIDSHIKNVNLPYNLFNKIVKLIKAHEHEFHGTFFLNINSLKQLEERYNTISSLIKTFGDISIKIISDYISSYKHFSNEDLINFVSTELIRLKTKVLKEPFFQPFVWGDYSIKELTTALELFSEGTNQHHCVGGYSESVSSGSCIIVSFSHLHNPSLNLTAEFRLSYVDNKSYSTYINNKLVRLSFLNPKLKSLTLNQLNFAFNKVCVDPLRSNISSLILDKLSFLIIKDLDDKSSLSIKEHFDIFIDLPSKEEQDLYLLKNNLTEYTHEESFHYANDIEEIPF